MADETENTTNAEPVGAEKAKDAKAPAAKKPAAKKVDAGAEKKPAAKKPAAKKAPAAKAEADGDNLPDSAFAKAEAVTPEEQAKAAKVAARATGETRPVRAVAKYLRFSAQKGRLVVDMIRGKSVVEAATILAFSKRDAAREIAKVLKSAVSNAENNHGMNGEELFVEAVFCDEGPTFKRWKPRARGKADRINKRTCHITLVVNVAPAALLEGRVSKSSAPGTRKPAAGDRSARVAASKEEKPKKPAAEKGPAKKPAKAKAEKAEKSEAAVVAADVEAPQVETPKAADTVAEGNEENES